MSKINLTEEELTKLLEAVNAGAEPTPELAGKLFPSLMEKLGQEGKFDFETLNRIKIPTIEYAGKRSEGVILASAAALGQSAPLQVVRSFGEPGKDGWKNLIVQGDNLQFLKTVQLNQDPLIRDKVKGKVKLICIDPPFATKSDFQGSDGERSYTDKVDRAEFIENMRERLIYLRDILSPDGSIYVHCDWRLNSYLRVVLDELFGYNSFRNMVAWHYSGWNKKLSNAFEKRYDSILFYTRADRPVFNSFFERWASKEEYVKKRKQKVRIDDDEREYVLSDAGGGTRIKRYLDEVLKEGVVVDDVWDIDKINNSATEALNYPTQKPEALLERIIKASSNPGDLVMDVFGGSGTTAAVAEKLGRRWITCDFGKHAIYTMQKRILNIADSKAFNGDHSFGNSNPEDNDARNSGSELQLPGMTENKLSRNDTKKNAKYGQRPKPFAVASVGAYDFSRIMNLRENKCAYISFVLALFGIPKEMKDFIKKYKLDHIYAEKDGNPVEIFPVWDDEFLYNVRIDLNYLKDIITQSRGKLKGNFYIIVPESCTQVSDMKVPNGSGGEVHFRFLKFPYSILEQASRNFAIEEQPDTPGNINNLVSSVGFYFNDEVTVKAKKTAKGLKICGFKTPILNRDGEKYDGISGLSLLLVDLNYNGKVFSMDSAIYAKEMKESGEVELAGVSGKTADGVST